MKPVCRSRTTSVRSAAAVSLVSLLLTGCTVEDMEAFNTGLVQLNQELAAQNGLSTPGDPYAALQSAVQTEPVTEAATDYSTPATVSFTAPAATPSPAPASPVTAPATASQAAVSPDQQTQAYLKYVAIYEPTGKPFINNARCVINTVETLTGRPGKLKAEFTEQVQKQYKTTNHTWVIHLVPASSTALVFSFEMNKVGGVSYGLAVGEGTTRAYAEADMAAKLKIAGGYNARILQTWSGGRSL